MSKRSRLPDGMVERPGRDGYYADFQVGGRRVRRFLSTDFKAACQILNDQKARADKAEYGILDNAYPLEELKRHYLRHCRQCLEASTVRCYEGWLGTIMPALGVVKVSHLSVAGVLAYRDRRLAKKRSPRTVNGEVGALLTMLNWGVDPARLIGSNPLAGLAPVPGLSLYSASKFAVRGYTLAAAHELRDKGIKVTVICPDAVQTPMLDLQVDYEQAALTFSGSRSLTTHDVVSAILNRALVKAPLEITLPSSRGAVSKFASIFPGLSALLLNGLKQRGLKHQRISKASR